MIEDFLYALICSRQNLMAMRRLIYNFCFLAVFLLNKVYAQSSEPISVIERTISHFQKIVFPVFDSVYKNFDAFKTIQRAAKNVDTIYYYNTSANKEIKYQELQDVLHDKQILLVDDKWYSQYFGGYFNNDGQWVICPVVDSFRGFVVFHKNNNPHYSFSNHELNQLIIESMVIGYKKKKSFFPEVINIINTNGRFFMTSKANKSEVSCRYDQFSNNIISNLSTSAKVKMYADINFKNKIILRFGANYMNHQIFTKLKKNVLVYYKIGVPFKETSASIKSLEKHYPTTEIRLLP